MMSYESEMLKDFKMPPRKEVEDVLLKTLFKHNGVIKEFGDREEIVAEMADVLQLNNEQKSAYLETIYRKENRVKRSSLWHRLLFRAADSLAKSKLISRPTVTLKLTNRKEWMLTEKGYDKVLELLNIPIKEKNILLTKSFEVQKVVKKLNNIDTSVNYNPINKQKKIYKTTSATSIRSRGFRQAVIEAYNFKCAICGLKIYSPDLLYWEVEAAHIVPHHFKGKDDILNGISLCRLHHWAFDTGWFTILDNYEIKVSSQTKLLPSDFGKIGNYEFFKLNTTGFRIYLPERNELFPHQNAISWHRQNIFHQ